MSHWVVRVGAVLVLAVSHALAYLLGYASGELDKLDRSP